MKLNKREVLSSSPEAFLRMSGRSVETRPIKGTRPRFEDEKEDQASARELLNSEKENAELIMITDLQRNDLGKVCEFGSVRVADMLSLEKLEHVYHLVSTVTGTLREEVDHLGALGACFPGGSITGAPKKRAIEIIEELETVPRGLYTGLLATLDLMARASLIFPFARWCGTRILYTTTWARALLRIQIQLRSLRKPCTRPRVSDLPLSGINRTPQNSCTLTDGLMA